MLYSDAETIYDKLLRELQGNTPIRRIRISPLFYHTLCSIIDNVPSNSRVDIDVIEDPAVEIYKIQY